MNNMESPYFIIRTNKLDSLIENIKESFYGFWNKGILGYSFKTNNTPWVISHMRQKGFFAEVVSSDEYLLAREIGFESDKIIFNGPAKHKKEFIYAVENGSIVNIDSNRELLWLLECNKDKLKDCKLGLRVNFCVEDYCPGESQCGSEDGRFGFSYERSDLKKAIEFLEDNKIHLSGLHLHCSSKTRSVNIYNAIATIAVRIVKEYNIHLDYIDIGGGYFGGLPNKPDFIDYFSKVYEIFSKEESLKNVNIIIEPGMCLIGASMDYVCTVIDTKTTKNNNFAISDGSRIHIDPLMKKSTYSYHINRINKQDSSSENESQILCGFTCMENDRFFNYNGLLLNVGDQIVFEKVGAYTISLSPQFIEFHPDIYAEINGEYSLVQSRKKVKQFIG